MSQQNLKFKTVPLQKKDQHSTIATAISKQYHCDWKIKIVLLQLKDQNSATADERSKLYHCN